MPDDPLLAVDPFAALADARARLAAATDGLDDAAALTPVHGEWLVRDVLAHIASWDEEVTALLRAFAGGRRDFERSIAPDDDYAEWNDAQVRAARESPTAALIARLDAAHAALLEAAAGLDAALFDERVVPPWGMEDSPRGYLVVQAMHAALHAEQIAVARE